MVLLISCIEIFKLNSKQNQALQKCLMHVGLTVQPCNKPKAMIRCASVDLGDFVCHILHLPDFILDDIYYAALSSTVMRFHGSDGS